MLGWLASDFFARSPVLAYPLFALLVFFVVFMAASIRAALTKRVEIEHLSRLPFSDEASDAPFTPDAPSRKGPRA